MPSKKLRECPFCGNAEIYTATEPNVSFGKLFAITCDRCYASTGYWSSKKLAVAAWNRRAGAGETPTGKGVGR